MCRVFPCVRHGSSCAEKWTSVGPWATAIREVAKHTPELAQLIVSNGGVAALVDYVNESESNNRLPGIMALGYIAAFSETLATAVIASKAGPYTRPLFSLT